MKRMTVLDVSFVMVSLVCIVLSNENDSSNAAPLMATSPYGVSVGDHSPRTSRPLVHDIDSKVKSLDQRSSKKQVPLKFDHSEGERKINSAFDSVRKIYAGDLIYLARFQHEVASCGQSRLRRTILENSKLNPI